MATPSQQGTALKTQSSPTFSSYVVVDGSWKVKDAVQHTETLDGASQTNNITFWNPGLDVTCEWVVKSASTPAAKGDVVSAGGTVSYLVLDVETSEYGGRPLKQSVTLWRRDSVTLS